MRRAVGPWDIAAARALRRIIDRLGPFDVIHGHSSKAGALARLVAPKGARRVYTPHGFRTLDPQLNVILRLIYGGAERILALLTDVVCVGSSCEAQEAEALGFGHSALRRITFGLPRPTLPSREEVRLELGLKKEEIVVGFVGRLDHPKMPEWVIESVAGSKNKNIKLVIAGDGGKRELVKNKARECGISDRVLLLGWVPGINVMPAFDLLMLPSHYESLGYVYIEALYAQVPVLTTPVGIAPDLYNSSIVGKILPVPLDGYEWSSDMDAYLQDLPQDPGAYEIISMQFSTSSMCKQVCQAYRVE